MVSAKLIIPWDKMEQRLEDIWMAIRESAKKVAPTEYDNEIFTNSTDKKFEIYKQFNRLVRQHLDGNMNGNGWSLEELRDYGALSFIERGGFRIGLEQSLEVGRLYVFANTYLLDKCSTLYQNEEIYDILHNHVLFHIWIQRYLERYPFKLRELDKFLTTDWEFQDATKITIFGEGGEIKEVPYPYKDLEDTGIVGVY